MADRQPSLAATAEARQRPPQLSAVEGLTPAKLSAESLSFYYGTFRALKDVSLEIPERRITALIGPSGCGKSTLLRIFNRMYDLVPGARVEGSVKLDGEEVTQMRDLLQLRRKVGMVFQRPTPFPMSIRDNVALALRLLGHGKAQVEETVERSLRDAGLWDEVKDRLNTPGTALSGGQQQRLCIARCLAVDPQVILMDEPCSALDPISTLAIEELMSRLAANYTIAIVTHNMQQAARVSNFTAFMLMNSEDRHGELIEFGPTSTIFNLPADKRTEDYITGRFG
ncbi:MAG TPA: phosphate ABC transporter ATP-binding protein PstB [Candidatus Dormibacteraeota bacterium]|jgi:phosphate transport system ATP-binding protein|nr:phosphate ABC transporter ATP-binding protein PstB [Candidatus Dormibacteraeota bacterium]